MAEQVVIEFAADTTKLQPAIDFLVKINQLSEKDAAAFKAAFQQTNEAIRQSTQQSIGQVQKLNDAVKNVQKTAAAAVVLDQSQGVVKTANAMVSLRSQIRAAEQQTAALAAQFGELDSRTIAAAKNAANLKERFSDAKRQIEALNPEAKFTAFTQLGSIIGGGFQAATGALQAFGVESEQATKLAQQFQGALNIAAGLNQLTGLKDALTNIKSILGVTTTATTAAAVANEGLAVAEGEAAAGATAAASATKGFTAALEANPIGITLVAVAALAAAFLVLSDDTDAAKESLAALNKELELNERDSKNIKRLADETAQSLQSQVDLLKAQGASKADILKAELELNRVKDISARKQVILNESEIAGLEDQAAMLAKNTSLTEKEYKEQSDVIFKRIDALKESNDQLRSEQKKYLDDSKILNAQFTKDSSDEAKKRGEEEKKAIQKVAEERLRLMQQLSDIEIKLAGDEDAQKIAQIQDDAKKQIEIEAEAFEKKIISLADFNKKYAKINNKAQKDIDTIRLARIAKSYNDEKALRENKLKEILDALNNDSIRFNTDQVNSIIGGAKELEASLEQQGFSRVQVAKKVNEFISEATKISNEEILQNDKETLIKQIDEATQAGGDIISLKDKLAKKEIDIENNKNKNILEAAEKEKQQRLDILNAIFDAAKNAASAYFDILSKQAENQIALLESVKNTELKSIDERLKANKLSLDSRLIGEKEFRSNEANLLLKKQQTEDEARKKENQIRHKQDISNRNQKLFEIAIATARNIAENPELYILYAALGAAQAALVLSRPLPQYYAKGTLKVPGQSGAGDSVNAWLTPGEAVIPVDNNKAYHPAVRAIYNKTIDPQLINRFVLWAEKNGKNSGSFAQNISNYMDIDYNKLGSSLAWHLRDLSSVNDKQVRKITEALKSYANSPYRN